VDRGPQERSDVVVALRANCQACGSVDDGLQTVKIHWRSQGGDPKMGSQENSWLRR